MYSLLADNVNHALALGLDLILSEGVTENSRNGPVLVVPKPVCIEYRNPRSRVLTSPTRDANPFFHFMESLWMLAGRNDIAFPQYFNSAYGQFSDDGTTMWDAYGWRWRDFFGGDQLAAIIRELRKNPQSRRCVLSMWSADAIGEPSWRCSSGRTHSDFMVAVNGGKAVPCNTHAYFQARNGYLNLTVMNRSNDAIWGCFGANAVHFSYLLEYVAVHAGLKVGLYYQFTNNLHVYTDKFDTQSMQRIIQESLAPPIEHSEPVIDTVYFNEELSRFMRMVDRRIQGMAPEVDRFKSEILNNVAYPMFNTWAARKNKTGAHGLLAFSIEGSIEGSWGVACREWLNRRDKLAK